MEQKNTPSQEYFSGKIAVYETPRKNNQRNLSTKGSFFEGEIYYLVKDGMVEFHKPTSLFNGKTLKPTALRSGWRIFTILCDDLPLGDHEDFEVDEANEIIRMYFN